MEVGGPSGLEVDGGQPELAPGKLVEAPPFLLEGGLAAGLGERERRGQ